MSKARLLLVIPDDDLSIKLFFAPENKAKVESEAVAYRDVSKVLDKEWDFIYIRGPFIQSDFDSVEVQHSINLALRNKGRAYSVDGLNQFSDLLLEDKWRQYQIFKKIMPFTELVESFKNINIEDRVIKKRISGRSRDIHFDLARLPGGARPQDYIIQDRYHINKEYRAFMIGGEVVLPLEIKSSKTENSRNRAIGVMEEAPDEVKTICRQVARKVNFDLLGLDIAETEDGFYLLEANRSPQFVNFLQLSSKNLAERLCSHLLTLIEK